MKLMSSLLLFALLAVTPQALGQRVKRIKFNNTMYLKKDLNTNKKLLLNVNARPLVNMINQMETVFADLACQNCFECMERAIRAQKTDIYLADSHLNSEELQNSVLHSRYKEDYFRIKRDAGMHSSNIVNETKPKTKTNKLRKSVTVMKYDLNGEIYALKVRETNDQLRTECRVYDVKQSFACDTAEAYSILITSRKKHKKEKPRTNIKKNEENFNVVMTTAKLTEMFRKREVDNSQIPENVMPSVEEMYF